MPRSAHRERFPYLAESDFFRFPEPEGASPEGIVAVGGNLSPGMLLSAYRQGIFPWYSEGEPLLWWSPDPRFVLFPGELHVSRSLRRVLSKTVFRCTADRAFAAVVERCRSRPRPGQDGTWITAEMRDAYVELHRLGYAHSVEAWRDGSLAGGLYGVSLGSLFFGESMFSDVPNASKAALAALVGLFRRMDITLIDCQVPSEHLASLGARTVPRGEFLRLLAEGLDRPTVKGPWETQPSSRGEEVR